MEGATRYAKSGELNIAYQVLGDGPFDLLFAPATCRISSRTSGCRRIPSSSSAWRRSLASSCSTGAARGCPIAILRSARTRRCSTTSVPFWTTSGRNRQRCSAVPRAAPSAPSSPRRSPSGRPRSFSARPTPDGPGRPTIPGASARSRTGGSSSPTRHSGTSGSFGLRRLAPTRADDERFRQWYAQACRFAGTPSSALAWFRVTMEIDIREVLAAIRVPTLVINSSGDQVIPPEAGRYLAEHIPGAKHVELPGSDHFPFTGEVDYVDEIEEFLTGSRSRREPDRVLATVLFTDIVGSTRACRRAGRPELARAPQRPSHDRARCLERFRGREVASRATASSPTFDGPARASTVAARARRSATPRDRDPGRPPHR